MVCDNVKKWEAVFDKFDKLFEPLKEAAEKEFEYDQFVHGVLEEEVEDEADNKS